MKALSYWALLHPKTSWLILTILHLVLAVLASYIGILLFINGVALPGFVFISGVTLFIVAWILYPVRRSKYKLWKWTYSQQKLLDFALIIGGLLMLITLNNQQAGMALAKYDNPKDYALEVALKEKVPTQSKPSIWENIKISRLKQSFQEKYITLVDNIQEAKASKPSKAWTIVGISLLMIGLIFVALFLGCAVECSGASGLGVILTLLSIIGIILIWVHWVKKVKVSKRS